jgi:hypothetical protein
MTGQPPTLPGSSALRARLESLGSSLGAREAANAEAQAEATRRAEALHRTLTDAIAGFQEALATSGAPAIAIDVGAPRLDDKHVRAVQIELRRGRNVAIVTVKSKGDVTLVGPFHAGKTEGPCQSVPWEAQSELLDRLGSFLEQFLEAALAT